MYYRTGQFDLIEGSPLGNICFSNYNYNKTTQTGNFRPVYKKHFDWQVVYRNGLKQHSMELVCN